MVYTIKVCISESYIKTNYYVELLNGTPLLPSFKRKVEECTAGKVDFNSTSPNWKIYWIDHCVPGCKYSELFNTFVNRIKSTTSNLVEIGNSWFNVYYIDAEDDKISVTEAEDFKIFLNAIGIYKRIYINDHSDDDDYDSFNDDDY